MALCLADSLLLHEHYDGADARVRWYNWWNNGYNNAFRCDRDRHATTSVGLGGNICKSLEALETYPTRSGIPPRHDAGGEDAGNGSIMRMSPVPIRFHFDVALAEQVAAEQSLGTHPGGDAAACCRFLAFFIAHAIKRGLPGLRDATETPTQHFVNRCAEEFMASHAAEQTPAFERLRRLLRSAEDDASKEVCWNWRCARLPIAKALQNRYRDGEYNGYPINPAYMGSYCMDGLAMALWGVYHSSCFEEAILHTVNLLGDSDSTGAVAGQMAGALYGARGIESGADWTGIFDADDGGTRGASRGPSMCQCWLQNLRK